MISIAILVQVSIMYLAILYWLFSRFRIKEIWRDGESTSQSVGSRRLTGFVKRILDVFMLLFSLVIVMWPPVLLVMAISQSIVPTWGIDVSAFAGFKIDINALPGVAFTGLRNPEISGSTLINIDTSNLFAWYFFAGVSELGAIITLYALVQLRALVISLKSGISFTDENARRIKKIGVVVILWNFFNPFLQYFGWGAVIKEITFSTSGIQFYPSFEINTVGIFIGLMLILLSGVLREAAEISREQELTI
jgi:hypothetical protein